MVKSEENNTVLLDGYASSQYFLLLSMSSDTVVCLHKVTRQHLPEWLWFHSYGCAEAETVVKGHQF